MTVTEEAHLVVNDEKKPLNVRPDIPDSRDRLYEPALLQLKPQLDNRSSGSVHHQGDEGSCTGFALAAVIDHLNRARGSSFQASPRMLYEMAKKHDKWPGHSYDYSSCRGAIQGWKNMGVCASKSWTYQESRPGILTVDRALEAREHTLGAYYRLRPEISDYHAALNEVGAIFVSALVHDGWRKPTAAPSSELAVIIGGGDIIGGHAFAIVGYNEDGFIIQNSWGKDWGSDGFALWRYEDWVHTVTDGWVFRLALATPSIFNVRSARRAPENAEFFSKSPLRQDIAGHFAHFDDGRFDDKGKYWSNLDDVRQTATRLRSAVLSAPNEPKYDHLMLYAHGGLNSPKASARRIAKMKDGFLRNGVYPYHIMYDTGLGEELKDVILRAFDQNKDRAEGFLDWLMEEVTDITDGLIEDASRKLGTAVWDEMKRDARQPFEKNADGSQMMAVFAEALKDTNLKVHLIGHSTGAYVHGHLLGALDTIPNAPAISTAQLMAPACTVDFYHRHFKPRLAANSTSTTKLPALDVYNLTNTLERDDNVAHVYRKSLITLVSRAFERGTDVPILGIQRFSEMLADINDIYSDGSEGPTSSTSHGGFDNDVSTMNSILQNILGHAPEFPFTKAEIE